MVAIAWCIILSLYFLPAFIAWYRKHPNVTAITALNLVAGWTFVGWVVALVWALAALKPR